LVLFVFCLCFNTMPTQPRYHQLPADEERASQEVPLVADGSDDALPSYADANSTTANGKQPSNATQPTTVFVLPSYEEVQQMKRQHNTQHTTAPVTTSTDTAEAERVVGTDAGFILSFLVAFLLNGIGFLCAFCMSSTFAGRYGATSGFGLAMVKLSVIFYHVYVVATGNDSDDDTWTTNNNDDSIFFFGVYRPGTPAAPAVDTDADMLEATSASTTSAMAAINSTTAAGDVAVDGEVTAIFYEDDTYDEPAYPRAQLWFIILSFLLGLLLFVQGIAGYVRVKSALRRQRAGL